MSYSTTSWLKISWAASPSELFEVKKNLISPPNIGRSAAAVDAIGWQVVVLKKYDTRDPFVRYDTRES